MEYECCSSFHLKTICPLRQYLQPPFVRLSCLCDLWVVNGLLQVSVAGGVYFTAYSLKLPVSLLLWPNSSSNSLPVCS